MSRKDEMLRVWTEHANTGYVPLFPIDYNFLKPKYIPERCEKGRGFDWFGVEWEEEKLCGFPMVVPGTQRLKDITRWREEIVFPDLTQLDWEACGAEETASWDRENKISLIMLNQGCFERTHALMGVEDALVAMMAEPEDYKDLVNAIADYKVEIVNIIGKYYKPDILMFQDDYGTAQNLFLSVESWREFFKEPLARIVKATHDNGMVYEHHSCGYMEPLIDDLLEIGIDALNPIQPCNNQRAIKEKYQGRLTFVGGEDSQGVMERPGVTEEEIRAELRRCYDLFAPGGGYANFPITIKYDYVPIMIDEHMKMARSYA